MSWESLFLVPLEQELFSYEWSASLNSSSNVGKSTSDHFLIRLRGYELENPVRTYENGYTVNRDWFNVYYTLSEFFTYPGFSNTPTVGETTSYNPIVPAEYNQALDAELYLPYKHKPGGDESGRIIGVKKMARPSGRRFFGHVEMFGAAGQFGQVMGSVSRRSQDEDKLLLEVFHWVELNAFPVIQHSTIEAQVYAVLTLEPQHFNAVVNALPQLTDGEIASALEELERRGDANKTAGRKGEYWSVAVPY